MTDSMSSRPRLRVAFVAGTLDRGGAEKQLFYMARALAREAVDVRVYSLRRGEFFEAELQRLGIRPIWIGRYAHPVLRTAALVRVLLRSWLAPTDAERSNERPFFGIYLPAHPENRRASQRSLIGPDDKFVPGGMVELDTGNARYLIRFTHTFERQEGWAWAMFTAVRKLGTSS